MKQEAIGGTMAAHRVGSREGCVRVEQAKSYATHTRRVQRWAKKRSGTAAASKCSFPLSLPTVDRLSNAGKGKRG